jgi:hypothetical protein
VVEGETVRVQAVPAVAGEAGFCLREPSFFVEGISDERMAGGREVDADLVGPAGEYLHSDERILVADLQYLDVRHGRLACG